MDTGMRVLLHANWPRIDAVFRIPTEPREKPPRQQANSNIPHNKHKIGAKQNKKRLQINQHLTTLKSPSCHSQTTLNYIVCIAKLPDWEHNECLPSNKNDRNKYPNFRIWREKWAFWREKWAWPLAFEASPRQSLPRSGQHFLRCQWKSRCSLITCRTAQAPLTVQQCRSSCLQRAVPPAKRLWVLHRHIYENKVLDSYDHWNRQI